MEPSHYRKRALWLKMLVVVACCVNWFNPLVYVMKRQFAYDMELACDGSVLAGRSEEERESYARIMLSFAGGKRDTAAFSTGFGGNRKRMKKRIDYMLDTSVKKKRILSIVVTVVFVLLMGVMVFCGYQSDDGEGTTGWNGADSAVHCRRRAMGQQ